MQTTNLFLVIILAICIILNFQLLLYNLFQAIQKKVNSNLILKRRLQNSPELKHNLNKLLSLCYLPSEDIWEGFVHLSDNLNDECRRQLGRIFDYYQNYWIGQVTPDVFSVYRVLRRTTNDVESHNALLFFKMKVHPTAWEFLGEKTLT